MSFYIWTEVLAPGFVTSLFCSMSEGLEAAPSLFVPLGLNGRPSTLTDLHLSHCCLQCPESWVPLLPGMLIRQSVSRHSCKGALAVPQQTPK